MVLLSTKREAMSSLPFSDAWPLTIDLGIREEGGAAMSFDFAQDKRSGIKDRGQAPLILSEVEGYRVPLAP